MTIIPEEVQRILRQRFGHDTLLSLATIKDGRPQVRIVDALYEDGCFYAITHALSGKMQQLALDPHAAVCGEWFTAEGLGENIGHPRAKENEALAHRLRTAFAAWYDNGHTNEDDPNTCILRVKLVQGVLMAEGKRYDVTFQ